MVSGGDGSFTYAWNDGPTTRDRSDLSAGIYSVEVTSCDGAETQTETVIVGEPDPLDLGATVMSPACNEESTGAIDLNPTGGNAPYEYNWAGVGVMQGIQDQSGLQAGTYTVVVTDAMGCSASRTFELEDFEVLIVNATPTQPAPGMMDGSIDLEVSGGLSPYSFAWTGPGVDPAMEDQADLGAGEYTVTVTDAAGCALTRTFTLEEGAPSLSATITPTCLNSADGAIDLSVIGGTPPYTYSWTSGLPAQQDQVELTTGSYTVIVTDAADRSSTLSIFVPALSPISLEATITPSTGLPDGAIDLSLMGGTGGAVTYQWSTGATSQDINMLVPGQYTVVVTDLNNGCTYEGVYDVTVDAQALVVETNVTDVQCNSANGGSCDGTFRLNIVQAIYPVTVVFTGGAAVGLPTSQTFTAPTDETYVDLCPGSFTVMATDAVGATYNEPIEIEEPEQLIISEATIIPVVGSGTATGGVNITVDGGTPPYSFQWSDGSTTEDLADVLIGDYTVTITDANDCQLISPEFVVGQFRIERADIIDVECSGDTNGSIDITPVGAEGPLTYSWSNGATTEDLENISAGEYTITILDEASGTRLMETYLVDAQSFVMATVQVVSDYNGAQISCPEASDGEATAGSGMAVGDVTFSWSNGATGQRIDGLAAGDYTVTVTDGLECSNTAEFSVVAPPEIDANLIANDVGCAGEENGRIVVQPLGGTLTATSGYSYLWSTGDMTQSIGTLSAGSYSVTVMDANNCERDFTAGITEPTPIEVDFEVEPAATIGSGEITLLPSGGTPPYSFQWEGRDDTTRVLSNLTFGRYVVSVTDANNCEPVVLEIDVKSSNFECLLSSKVLTPGDADGLNDVFLINCIQDFPDNSLEVFNRWGQLVYERIGYDNVDDPFDGRIDGDLLPEGGYFYVLRYRDPNGDQQLLKGSLNLIL